MAERGATEGRDGNRARLLGRLQRYVLSEFARSLLLAAGVFTGFFVLMTILSLEGEARRYGTTATTLLGTLPYFLPYILCFSLPMAFLVAAVLTFGRLEGAGEISAMRAAGVRLTTVAAPVIALALVTVLPVLFLVDTGVEWGFASAREMVMRSGRASVLSRAGAGTTLRIDTDERSYRIHRFGEGTDGLAPLAIVEFAGGAPREVVLARDHELDAEGGESADGTRDLLRFRLGGGGEGGFGWARITKPGEVLLAREGELSIATESAARRREKVGTRPHERGLSQNVRDAKELREKLASLEGWGLSQNVRDAKELREKLPSLGGRARESSETKLRALEMEIHRKLSFAFAPLALLLFGIPLGLGLARGGRLAGFIVGIAAIAFFYYPLWFAGQGLALGGALPAWVAVWIAQVVAGGGGAAWFSRLV